MTDMLGARMDKVYSMQEQMGKISREMEILSKKKKEKEMLRIKNIITEMNNAFDGPVDRTHEERIPGGRS